MDKKINKVEITVSNKTVIRILLLIVATFLGIRFVLSISHALTLIFSSVFLAIALNPAVSWISRKLRIKSRATATGIAYVSVLVVLIAFMSAVIPPLVRQTSDFISTIPNIIEDSRSADTGVGRLIQKYGLQDSVDKFADDMRGRVKDLPQPVLSTASRVGSGLVSLIAVLFMTFMMIVEGPEWLSKILELQSGKRRAQSKKLALQVYRVITNYVNGQLIIAAIAAGFALVAMVIASNIFGVYINSLGLAGIIALTGLIPMIGNSLGAIIVVLVSALTSFPLAIFMAIFFLLYQQIENVTIQPYIQSKKNELSPLLVFISALCGIGLGGLLGGFIAIPLAACFRLIFLNYLENRSFSNINKIDT
ncbi:AI-2E family transporter [Candidatus Saccharibacteria bacterium]|nr:AI-2E family transporter [Candidatus Saccharibacteria bacterium]